MDVGEGQRQLAGHAGGGCGRHRAVFAEPALQIRAFDEVEPECRFAGLGVAARTAVAYHGRTGQGLAQVRFVLGVRQRPALE